MAAQATVEWQAVQERNRRDAVTAHRRRVMTMERIARRARAADLQHRVAEEPPIQWPEDDVDRKSTRLNSSHSGESRMPSSA